LTLPPKIFLRPLPSPRFLAGHMYVYDDLTSEGWREKKHIFQFSNYFLLLFNEHLHMSVRFFYVCLFVC
jgi:hypothetical protein